MLAWSILVVAIITIIHLIKRVKTYNALAEFKGPWLAGWSRLWLLRANSSGRMHEFYKDVNDKFGKSVTDRCIQTAIRRLNIDSQQGSTARIGPSYLLTSDPVLIRRMNSVRSPYARAKFYNALRIHPQRDNIVSVRDEQLHDELRYKMAAGVSLPFTVDTPFLAVP